MPPIGGHMHIVGLRAKIWRIIPTPTRTSSGASARMRQDKQINTNEHTTTHTQTHSGAVGYTHDQENTPTHRPPTHTHTHTCAHNLWVVVPQAPPCAHAMHHYKHGRKGADRHTPTDVTSPPRTLLARFHKPRRPHPTQTNVASTASATHPNNGVCKIRQVVMDTFWCQRPRPKMCMRR